MGYPRAVHYAAALALSLPFTAPVSAQNTLNGNTLLDYCKDDNTTWMDGYCAGMIVGVLRGMDLQALLSKGATPYCLRQGVTNKQVRDVVVAWLRSHPEKRDYEAESVVAIAMREGFPCPNAK